MTQNNNDVIKVKKNSISKILIAVVITAVISVSITSLIFYFAVIKDPTFIKLKQLKTLAEDNYYGELDEAALDRAIFSGFASGLGDRFAGYYDAEETRRRNDSIKGNAQGLGMIVVKNVDSQGIYIKHVYDHSPAKEQGLMSGDIITAVDSVDNNDVGYEKALNSIIREVGEKVTLTVNRADKTFDVELTFSEFESQTVFCEMLDTDIGYVIITSFNSGTVTQFQNGVNSLITQGAKSLIFDLRQNGGGTVDSVCEMVDFLCGEGDIMTVEYADGSRKVIARSDKEEVGLPMVCLTDGNTASAAELFTASIIDFGKGISVGSTTFGKGVMQSTFPLFDKSSMVFTIAEFFPHSGKSFNKKGIEPQIKVELTEEQSKYFHTLSPQDDPVISAAKEYLK